MFILALGSAHTSIPLVPRALFPTIRQLGREATSPHPPPSARVTNAWNYTYIPPCVFMVWWLIRYRDNTGFTFYLYRLCELTDPIKTEKVTRPCVFPLKAEFTLQLQSTSLSSQHLHKIVCKWYGPVQRETIRRDTEEDSNRGPINPGLLSILRS
jgi:hypothetical protein